MEAAGSSETEVHFYQLYITSKMILKIMYQSVLCEIIFSRNSEIKVNNLLSSGRVKLFTEFAICPGQVDICD
jgi:hypothetical protein